MFYGTDLVFLTKKDPLSLLWFAALHVKKISKKKVLSCDVVKFTDQVMSKKIKNLRVTGTLLLGLVVIYQKKTNYLVNELKMMMKKVKKGEERMVKDINMKEGVSGNVDMVNKYDCIENVLEECFNNEVYFENKVFERNLKNLLERGLDDELGFRVDVDLATPLMSQNTLTPEHPLKTIDINDETLSNININDDYQRNVDFGDTIDFGDLGNLGPPHPTHEEQEDIDLNNAETLLEVDISESIDQISKINEKMKKSRKRKRVLIDKEVVFDDDYIKQCITYTGDITTRRPIIPKNRKNRQLSFKQLIRLPNIIIDDKFESKHDPKLLKAWENFLEPPRKRRKLDIKSVEIPRFATQDEMQIDLEEPEPMLYSPTGEIDFPSPDVKAVPFAHSDNVQDINNINSLYEEFERHIFVKGEYADYNKYSNDLEELSYKYYVYIKFHLKGKNFITLSDLIHDGTYRKIAGLCFCHTLVLTKKGYIITEQDSEYGEIRIYKGSKYYD